MEKLSHIIKSNGHYNVDLSKERPVRSGVPSFGQPVSKSVHVYEAPEESMGSNPLTESKMSRPSERPSDLERQTEIADRITFNFAKRSELPAAAEKNEEADMVAEKEPATVAASPNSNGHKNVNLSIYV